MYTFFKKKIICFKVIYRRDSIFSKSCKPFRRGTIEYYTMEKDLKEQKVSDCIDYFGGQLKDQFKNSKWTTYCDYRQLSLIFHCQATTEMQPFGCKSANLRYKTPVWYPEIDNLLKSLQLPRSKLRATAENDQNQKIYITDGNKKQRQTNAFAQHHSWFGAICVAPSEQYSCLTIQYWKVGTSPGWNTAPLGEEVNQISKLLRPRTSPPALLAPSAPDAGALCNSPSAPHNTWTR